ncbi:uncharacterized protein LOC128890378 [Hylaeus anthracinus]|uniref:uncharacterized protein LOC128890378 n=1 Tax=Hylaeus anthracinus TaxID=313031 RepID=UPI0023B992F4|nr:uncharacterized protein LOC128890378 [Hylaeus anthracinus]
MLLAIYMIAQLIPLLTRQLTTIEILKNISPICMLLCAIYKHIVFWRQAETIKEFMEEVKHDWGSMNDEELKILKEYAYLGKRYSTIFAMFVSPSVVIAMAAHFTSDILDIVSPLNESRPHWSPVATEYFVDQQKYFYPIMLYENLAIFAGGTMFVGTESLITMWLHHFAALFKIIW